MKKTLPLIMLLIFLCAPGEAAHAKGCVKGAVVGGVLGHYAGHHGALGAIAGCLYGRHEANKRTYDVERDGRRRGWL